MVTEKTMDVVEETVETLERIPKGYLNGTSTAKAYTILGITALAGAATGGLITYKLTGRNLRLKYAEIAKQEIQEARDFYRTQVGKDGMTPEEVVEERVPGPERLKVEVEKLDYTVPETVEEDEEAKDEPVVIDEEVHSIFKEGGVVGFDYELEVSRRTEEAPYIITHIEYNEGEKGYEQSTLTYFEDDDVLADERDQMVEEVEATAGHDNLEKFGYGSDDPNTVYIRNDRVELDMEIVRSRGSYAKEVLGFDASELKHSDKRRPRRMRADDD